MNVGCPLPSGLGDGIGYTRSVVLSTTVEYVQVRRQVGMSVYKVTKQAFEQVSKRDALLRCAARRGPWRAVSAAHPRETARGDA